MASELKGLKELSKKLKQLDNKMARKTLRSSAFVATTPTFKKMGLKAPKGTRRHKTYKGRIVRPGFLKKSFARRVGNTNKGISIIIGVLKEAFYGPQFLDQGISVKKRTYYKKINGRKRKITKKIKPYTISARNFFKQLFIKDRKVLERNLTVQLKKRIDEVTKK